jgi:hypothetical protein
MDSKKTPKASKNKKVATGFGWPRKVTGHYFVEYAKPSEARSLAKGHRLDPR